MSEVAADGHLTFRLCSRAVPTTATVPFHLGFR
jgi:hypothetical protein